MLLSIKCPSDLIGHYLKQRGHARVARKNRQHQERALRSLFLIGLVGDSEQLVRKLHTKCAHPGIRRPRHRPWPTLYLLTATGKRRRHLTSALPLARSKIMFCRQLYHCAFTSYLWKSPFLNCASSSNLISFAILFIVSARQEQRSTRSKHVCKISMFSLDDHENTATSI